MLPRRFFIAMTALATLLASGCHSAPTGTYKDATGSLILDLKSGGKATLTFLGKPGDCTYSSSGNQLSLTCNGDPTNPTVFTIDGDGTLNGPPGSFITGLHKQK